MQEGQEQEEMQEGQEQEEMQEQQDQEEMQEGQEQEEMHEGQEQEDTQVQLEEMQEQQEQEEMQELQGQEEMQEQQEKEEMQEQQEQEDIKDTRGKKPAIGSLDYQLEDLKSRLESLSQKEILKLNNLKEMKRMLSIIGLEKGIGVGMMETGQKRKKIMKGKKVIKKMRMMEGMEPGRRSSRLHSDYLKDDEQIDKIKDNETENFEQGGTVMDDEMVSEEQGETLMIDGTENEKQELIVKDNETENKEQGGTVDDGTEIEEQGEMVKSLLNRLIETVVEGAKVAERTMKKCLICGAVKLHTGNRVYQKVINIICSH